MAQHGGARRNAGRKPNIVKHMQSEAALKYLSPAKEKQFWDKFLNSDNPRIAFEAFKLWLDRRYGKAQPREEVVPEVQGAAGGGNPLYASIFAPMRTAEAAAPLMPEDDEIPALAPQAQSQRQNSVAPAAPVGGTVTPSAPSPQPQTPQSAPVAASAGQSNNAALPNAALPQSQRQEQSSPPRPGVRVTIT